MKRCVFEGMRNPQIRRICLIMTGCKLLVHSRVSYNSVSETTMWEKVPSDMCAQRRLKSACASAQSDQSLRCPREENLYILGFPKCAPVKIQISLRECGGWSVPSLSVHVRRYDTFSIGVAGGWNKKKTTKNSDSKIIPYVFFSLQYLILCIETIESPTYVVTYLH